jgi:hypothetical protein
VGCSGGAGGGGTVVGAGAGGGGADVVVLTAVDFLSMPIPTKKIMIPMIVKIIPINCNSIIEESKSQ